MASSGSVYRFELTEVSSGAASSDAEKPNHSGLMHAFLAEGGAEALAQTPLT